MHNEAYALVRRRYPIIFKGSSGTGARAARSSGIMNFGMRGLIYEVALTGIIGRVRDVEDTNMWEFFNTLGFLRSQEAYRNALNR